MPDDIKYLVSILAYIDIAFFYLEAGGGGGGRKMKTPIVIL